MILAIGAGGAIQDADADGATAKWGQHVTDEDYGAQ
jgi:hypothetical protein